MTDPEERLIVRLATGWLVLLAVGLFTWGAIEHGIVDAALAVLATLALGLGSVLTMFALAALIAHYTGEWRN